MKVNIYYGGRGLVEDPTIYVINKLTEVLQEVRANVTRYNLYEQKNSIAMLPNTLKEADAIILAVSVEWYGIGGFMQQFLDACWMFADKTRIKKLYMFPVVVATGLGERDAEYLLIKSWEALGGSVSNGICTYVENPSDFEANAVYAGLIEKKGEDIYRTVHQKTAAFPTGGTGSRELAGSSHMGLTPQESERLSEYVSNENFVKKQKEDVEKLAQMYLTKLDKTREEDKQEFIAEFKKTFKAPDAEFAAVYQIVMTDTGRTLVLEIKGKDFKCRYGEAEGPDVYATTTREVINKLVNGRTTFQGSFMAGQITCKGDFKIMRAFDEMFMFGR